MGQSAKEKRRQKAAELRAQREREARRRKWIKIGAIGAVVVLVVAFVGYAGYREYKRRNISGVEVYEGLSNNHVTDPVDYEQTPPVGGDHHAMWQNCGVYTEPLADIHAVHALEHGAVWITHDPELPQEQVETLHDLHTPGSYVLVSPYEGEMPGPVVASAWGHQLVLDSADDSRLEAFLRLYEQGDQTLEPGASCSGGLDRTAAELEDTPLPEDGGMQR